MTFDTQLSDARTTCRYSSLLPTAARVSHRDIQNFGDQDQPPRIMPPRDKQPSLFQTRKVVVRGTLLGVTVLPVLLTVWAAIVLNAWKGNLAPISMSEMGNDNAKVAAIITCLNGLCHPPPAISLFPWQSYGYNNASFSTSATSFVCLLLVFCIQAYLTFALHCVEVLVNSARDQRVWERATKSLKSSSGGVSLESNVVLSFLTSPPNMLLLVSKTAAHWLFNGSLLPLLYLSTTTVPMVGPGWQDLATQINLFGVPTLFLLGLIMVLLASICYVAFKRPSGPQPSTYGHIQTLAELIDEWGKGDRLFWGDKGLAEDGRHRRAGTSGHGKELEEIHHDAEYI